MYLENIYSPADVKKLSFQELNDLSHEIRASLLQKLSAHGGHFGPNFGMVEATIALHYVFNSPKDKIVYDVSHQSYVHKMLTGRKDAFLHPAEYDHVSGYSEPQESEHDFFVIGHTSTSVSLASGLAKGRDLTGGNENIIAVIGDGSLSGGEAFEGLDYVAELGTNMIIIVNDNQMSIAENHGGLYKNLKDLRDSNGQCECNFFKAMGLDYMYVNDGNCVEALIEAFSKVKDIQHPIVVHINTLKGKGYEPAEKDPIGFHGVPKFDPISGQLPKSNAKPTYSKIFGDWLCEMAEQDDKLVGITPAMREGSGMVEFSERFPQQYFDVAIAEQHAVTFAAGLAIGGYKPVVAIYSTFLQRAYDQLIHDVAIQNLPVLFAIDRAGIVGADGQTHQGAFDLSFMRCIPNMIIMTPSDENECRQMLYTGYKCGKPAAVRYPRGNAIGVELTPLAELEIGRSKMVRQGEKVAILNFGTLLPAALSVAEKLNATVVDMRFVKPIDEARILEMADTHDVIVTLEENAIQGGAGSAVSEVLNSHGKTTALLQLGLPDFFIPQGTQQEALAEIQLDEKGIEEQIIAFIKG
mgnify:CR=1 FL=1